MRTIQDVLARLRAEYLETPGLRLTAAQVQGLCDIEPTLCRSVLDALVKAKFLCVAPDGRYRRPTEEAAPRARVVKTRSKVDRGTRRRRNTTTTPN
jgi:hypothetical protein